MYRYSISKQAPEEVYDNMGQHSRSINKILFIFYRSRKKDERDIIENVNFQDMDDEENSNGVNCDSDLDISETTEEESYIDCEENDDNVDEDR